MSDLVSKMTDLCGDKAYTCKYMKKITEYFQCEIVMAEVNGKKNVITFKSTADSLLHSFYRKSDSSAHEKEALIQTAANLIAEDIKALSSDRRCYPTSEEIASMDAYSKYIPQSLMMFLEHIFTGKVQKGKVASIGQCIVQGCLPRSTIAPLQIGLGVQMHHDFGSKFLIDTLNSLGFCSSYTEVQRYESSAAQNWDIDIDRSSRSQAVQFVAENVDHNVGTIDGYNTFHGMGIIATITPGTSVTRIVPRIKSSSKDLETVGKINVTFFAQNKPLMADFCFHCLDDSFSADDSTLNSDFLLKVTRPLLFSLPSWSGFMQTVQRGSYPGKSSIVFLPMIDMNPSDLTCIYSILKCVSQQAEKLNVSPVLTFDQLLYWKALQIVSSECPASCIKSTVLRLGAFHTDMSFLGCIGQLMENTGLQEVIETVYASNSVTQMFSGKSVSRAMRAHFLVYDALSCLLLEKFVPDNLQAGPTVRP